MAQFGSKQTDRKILPAAPNYEFIVLDVHEVPNDKGLHAYNPATDEPKMATKWEWVFGGRPGTAAEGVLVKKKTSSYMTTHPKNGWLVMSKAVDPTLVPKDGYASEDDFFKRSLNRPVMLGIQPSDPDAEGNIYNNIKDPYPSALEPLSAADFDALRRQYGIGTEQATPAQAAAAAVLGEEIPF